MSRILAIEAHRQGRCLRVRELLEAKSDLLFEEQVMLIESLHLLGLSGQAERSAKDLLVEHDLLPEHASRCTAMLADQHWYSGRFDAARELYHKAVTLAERGSDPAQLCRSTIQLLERTSEETRFDSSLPLANRARRYANRCGDAQLSASIHLTFGRLEAKAGHFDTARKHLQLARDLLARDTNIWLLASVELDDSGVLSLIGDIWSAIKLAQRGAYLAEESGWSRGKVAAAANLASFFVSLGRLDEAQVQIRKASKEPFLSPSFQLAFAETRARAELLSGNVIAAEEVLEEHTSEDVIQPWYRLTAQETRSRILLAQQRWLEAVSAAEVGIDMARGTNPQVAAAFKLIRAEALVGGGMTEQALDLPIEQVHVDWPIALKASFHSVIGKALLALSQPREGAAHALRAQRIYQAAGSGSEPIGVSASSTSEGGTPEEHRPDLDTAVVLLELAGHPQILGREAFAVLKRAGCAEGIALVAVGSGGTRILAAHGWSERDALAAVRAAAPDDLVTLGDYRDETWRILVQPKPTLEDRCTAAGVRKLLVTARTLDQYRRDEKQRAALWPAEALDGDPESVWASEQTAELLTIGRRIANSPVIILLTGETGTGKEMLARAIHRASERADRTFLPFNCTAVPRDMLDSQLFGHRKGAFTGADAAFSGVIRAAAGGTLFLDEIAEVGLDVQPKLLRFLESHEVHPLGELHPVKVDVHIIAATNANLEQLVAEGRFREDLFYRLNVVRLRIPALRERREEIPLLVQHYLRRFGDEQKKGRLTISDELLEYLVLYSWPGNVRQLANEVRRMVAFATPNSTLTPALLSPEILATRRTIAASDGEPEIRVRLDQPLPAAVEALEQAMVRRALDRAQGRVEDASRLLGISRKGLFLKRRRWGVLPTS